jgi:hypothetical protein
LNAANASTNNQTCTYTYNFVWKRIFFNALITAYVSHRKCRNLACAFLLLIFPSNNPEVNDQEIFLANTSAVLAEAPSFWRIFTV